MFSQAGIKPTTLTLGCKPAKARNVPSTLAAPHMSNFISSISGAGLSEMPPVSKVMPLPTKTVGATALAAPLYFKTINRSGWSEPCATDMNEPMPSLATSLSPRTSTLMFLYFDKLLAALPSSSGVAWLAGRFPHSFANSIPAIAGVIYA